jgi:hypothetical protein
MYRFGVEKTATYTPDDLVLFRESPFALWMERLTFENPDHGIPPDIQAADTAATMEPRDDLVATLRAEGRNVVQVDTQADETERRAATLAAMRAGVDFVIGGQLAEGRLSGAISMLMRTSGYSELGDFLYIPCATESAADFHSAFQLGFFADLLHRLQGQLPPQMLIIRGDGDVQPLQTDDHIYYYLAVKQRFLDAMDNFRKHRMPDPAESSHFGRWSDCASEVLKQRALREGAPAEELPEEGVDEDVGEEFADQAMAVGESLQVAGGGARAYLASEPVPVSSTRAQRARATLMESAAAGASARSATLAEQASELVPGSYRADVAPGRTPNLARFPRPVETPPSREEPPVEDIELELTDSDWPAVPEPEEVAAEPDFVQSYLEEASPAVPQPTQSAVQEASPAEPEPTGSGPQEASPMEPDAEPLPVRPDSAQPPPASLSPVRQNGAGERSGSEARQSGAGHGPDPTLQNLEFIGSGLETPSIGMPAAPRVSEAAYAAPAAELAEPPSVDAKTPETGERRSRVLPDIEPREPQLLPPEDAPNAEPVATDSPAVRPGESPHPLDSRGVAAGSMVDMDSAPPPSLSPVVERAETEFRRRGLDTEPVRPSDDQDRKEDAPAPGRDFSDSLITGEDFEDR